MTQPMKIQWTAVTIAAFSLLALSEVRAGLPAYAPSLSVHESHYGIQLNGAKQENVQSIQIRLLSHAETETAFEVQSFFLKKGTLGGLPQVDDTVIFDVVRPHATYQVAAKPIPLSSGATTSKSKSAKSSKNSSSTGAATGGMPRDGFIVRIIQDGKLIREHYSTHQLQEFAKAHSEILDQAADKKSARHLDAKDLLVR